MKLFETIGRMLLGAAIFRSMRRSPKWVLIAAALIGLALMSIGSARAQTAPPSYNGQGDQPQAWAACQSFAAYSQQVNANAGPYSCRPYPAGPNSVFQCVGRTTLCYGQALFSFTTPCPADAPWNPDTGTCGTPRNECDDKPDYGGAMVSGASEFCHEGCAYRADSAVQVCLGEGAGQTCFGGSWKPTGGKCSSGPQPMAYDQDKDVCERKPGASHSQCVKPSGDTCVVSAKGNRFCWKPGESGDRMTADGSEGATKGEGNQQQPPPRSMTEPQHQGTSTTTTTTNNNTTVNSTSVFTGSGSTGGQSNVGTGGRDTGTGSGSGSGDGDGDGDGPGAPGGQPGRLYEGKGEKIEAAFQQFAQRAEQTPLIGLATNVLGGCSGGGACPAEAWDGGEFAGTHSIAEWCSGPLAALLVYAGYVLLAGMGAVSLRIALL